jgi:hypothetical protein
MAAVRAQGDRLRRGSERIGSQQTILARPLEAVAVERGLEPDAGSARVVEVEQAELAQLGGGLEDLTLRVPGRDQLLLDLDEDGAAVASETLLDED